MNHFHWVADIEYVISGLVFLCEYVSVVLWTKMGWGPGYGGGGGGVSAGTNDER